MISSISLNCNVVLRIIADQSLIAKLHWKKR